MNAVIIAVLLMIILSLMRVHVVIALIIGALAGGLLGGLGMEGTISTFTNGLGENADIALSYAVLGAFAVALTRTGLHSCSSMGLFVSLVEKENRGQKHCRKCSFFSSSF